jgi:hypothetical protein
LGWRHYESARLTELRAIGFAAANVAGSISAGLLVATLAYLVTFAVAG